MAKWLQGEIVENYQWSERLFSLRLKAPLETFKAGQFVRVALDVEGEEVARPYSLVNAPGEELLEIYFNIVPEGPLTPQLAKMKPGDAIKIGERASGFLIIDEVPEARHLWMLATGTGIGPFLSILRTEDVWQRFEKVVLGYSVRSEEELSYRELIEQLLQQHIDQLSFVPFITREKVEGSINARITSAIEQGDVEARTGFKICAEDSHVMMCGNSAMIMQVTELLKQRGMRKHLRRERGHITMEKYH